MLLPFFLFSGSGKRVPLESVRGRLSYNQAVTPPMWRREAARTWSGHPIGSKKSCLPPLSLPKTTLPYLCPCSLWRMDAVPGKRCWARSPSGPHPGLSESPMLGAVWKSSWLHLPQLALLIQPGLWQEDGTGCQVSGPGAFALIPLWAQYVLTEKK